MHEQVSRLIDIFLSTLVGVFQGQFAPLYLGLESSISSYHHDVFIPRISISSSHYYVHHLQFAPLNRETLKIIGSLPWNTGPRHAPPSILELRRVASHCGAFTQYRPICTGCSTSEVADLGNFDPRCDWRESPAYCILYERRNGRSLERTHYSCQGRSAGRCSLLVKLFLQSPSELVELWIVAFYG